MKTTKVVVITAVLAALVIGLASYSSTAADKTPAMKASAKIAVVNLREIFQKNKLNEDFDAKLEQEKTAAMQDIDAATKQVDAYKAQMKRLVVGTTDYLTLMSKALEQQGMVQAKKEYYQQAMDSRQARFTEDVYTKTKEVIAEYAAKNGIDMVLVKDEIQFPAASPNDLMLALSTRKVLYSAPEMDITAQVLDALNARVGSAPAAPAVTAPTTAK
jgi:Skp family chaperone for outer membrane proteins